MFKKLPGTVCMIISSVLFALGGILIKAIPWNPIAINGSRAFIAVWVILAYMKISGEKLRVNRTVLVGALCLTLTTMLYAAAIKQTTAGNAMVLQYTSPIFVLLWNRLFFGKKPQRDDIIACICVFFGVVIFFIDSLSAGGGLGNLMAFGSGMTFAGVFMMNQGKDASPLSSVAVADIMSFVIGIPFILKTDIAGSSSAAIVSMLLLGLLQLGLAYVFFTEGLKTTPPVTASLLSVIEVILNPVLVAIFMHEMLTPLALAGAVIILVSITVYNVLKAKRSQV